MATTEPTTAAPAPPSLDRPRLVVVLASIAVTMAWFVALKVDPRLGWASGLWINGLQNAIFLAFAWRYRDALFPRLMLFGLCVGLAELFTDAWEVDGNRTLIYPKSDGPLLWRSPAWMPLAWETTSVALGYLGIRLKAHLGPAGLVAAGLVGACVIPFYESTARSDHLWTYVHCKHMIGFAPVYIVLTEFLCTIAIAAGATYAAAGGWLRAAVAGLAAGLAILPCAVASYYLVERVF